MFKFRKLPKLFARLHFFTNPTNNTTSKVQYNNMSATPKIRPIAHVQKSTAMREGAGVIVRRTIGGRKLDYFDPFLLLDEFNTENPNDYIAGFPDHPHRGFETVTYMLDGLMEHKDHKGNQGLLKSGAVQWMTAGRGIIHSEMPKQEQGKMRGFQMWVNLPAKNKMMEPRYQDIQPEFIPVVHLESGVKIKVMAGKSHGTEGAVKDIVTDPLYVDITLPPGIKFTHPVDPTHNVWTYVFEGEASFGEGQSQKVSSGSLVLYEKEGDTIQVSTEGQTSSARFLLASAKPLNEPMARYGPFVMNTQEEIMQAFMDFQSGKF